MNEMKSSTLLLHLFDKAKINWNLGLGALCKLGQWVQAPHLGDHPASGHLFYMLKVYVRPAPGQILGVLGFWNLLEFDFLQ